MCASNQLIVCSAGQSLAVVLTSCCRCVCFCVFQDSIDVCVFEGERGCTDGNNLLGQFTITGIERAKRGVPKIDVTFDLDANGILTVTAADVVTKSENKISISNNRFVVLCCVCIRVCCRAIVFCLWYSWLLCVCL